MTAAVPVTWQGGVRVGRFELVRELARGGMAEIWVAQDKTPGGASQPVVVKRMLGEDDDAVPFTMLLDEARILSQLNHPGIVRVFGLEELSGSPAIVMELVSGITLEELLALSQKKGKLPAPVAVHIASKVASALGYAHRKTGANDAPLQIIHRDVSPPNIMITEQGGVKLLDFGIARARNRSTKTVTGYIKGKVAYMSPEQSAGKPLDARSDVFSLALVLYEMLTGQSVYAGKNETQIASMLAGQEKFPSVHEHNPTVVRSLEMLIEEAMSIDPKGRPEDGVFFAQRLDGWLSFLPTKPHESDLAQYLTVVRAPAAVAPKVVPPAVPPPLPGEATAAMPVPAAPVPVSDATVDKASPGLPMKVTQRTPSYKGTPASAPSAPSRPRKTRVSPVLIAVGALLLFGASVAVGWITSHRVWAQPAERTANSAVSPTPSP